MLDLLTALAMTLASIGWNDEPISLPFERTLETITLNFDDGSSALFFQPIID